LSHIVDEHIDGSLHIELREDVERMRKIDLIAPLVALKQSSELG